MEDADVGALSTETLKTQIERVTKRTNKSHVMVFGDTSFESETIGNFENRLQQLPSSDSSSDGNDVDVRDLPLKQAIWLWDHAENEQTKVAAAQQMERIVVGRLEDTAVFGGIVKQTCDGADWLECIDHLSNARSALQDTECHMRLTRTIHDHCPRRADHNPGGWNAFNMKFSQTLVNMCEDKDALGKNVDELNDITLAGCGGSRAEASTVVV